MEPKTVALTAAGLGLLTAALGAGAWWFLRQRKEDE